MDSRLREKFYAIEGALNTFRVYRETAFSVFAPAGSVDRSSLLGVTVRREHGYDRNDDGPTP
jgi:hypothetical protein